MSFRTILFVMLSAGLLLGLFSWATGDKNPGKEGLIAFYNVENLFDTLDDPHKSDNDFLPGSALKWNKAKYTTKQQHLAQVLSNLNQQGMVLLGLAEVENRQVVEELLRASLLSSAGYRCIHEESADPRGIDVALIHSSAYKPLSHQKLRPCKGGECMETRDILAVKGVLMKDTVWVFVNHWPSRRAGVEESSDKRLFMSSVLKQTVDSVFKHSPRSKIVIMGDFNDTPDDPSVRMLTKGEQVFNPFHALVQGAVGSTKYQKDWFIYDQILLSANWTKDKKSSGVVYQNNTAAIYHPLFLHYRENLNNGPFRSYKGKMYYGGYSDHFPVYFKYTY